MSAVATVSAASSSSAATGAPGYFFALLIASQSSIAATGTSASTAAAGAFARASCGPLAGLRRFADGTPAPAGQAFGGRPAIEMPFGIAAIAAAPFSLLGLCGTGGRQYDRQRHGKQ